MHCLKGRQILGMVFATVNTTCEEYDYELDEHVKEIFTKSTKGRTIMLYLGFIQRLCG